MVGFAVAKINFSCVFSITAHVFIRKSTKKVNIIRLSKVSIYYFRFLL